MLYRFALGVGLLLLGTLLGRELDRTRPVRRAVKARRSVAPPPPVLTPPARKISIH